ncbi:TIGR02206 family membrane protein [Bacteroidota bacterium]
MKDFFNPSGHSEIINPMYGTVHMLLLLGVLIIILLLIWQKDKVKKLAGNRKFMRRFMIVFLAIEVGYTILLWAYKTEPFSDRFPLHLCATLSFLMPILILLDNRKLIRFFAYWSICAGFISFVNANIEHDPVWGIGFIHYCIRHYFLFLIPIFLQIGYGFQHSYRVLLYSIGALAVYAFLIFLLDWATGANYMHLGPNNTLEVPFLPKSFTVWPWSYPSFSGVGIILFHLAYLALSSMSKAELRKAKMNNTEY